MSLIRSHELENGKTFDTCSFGGGPSIVIPISQLEGMSEAQIGAAVLALVDEADITYLLDWVELLEANTGRLENYPEKQRHTTVCTLLVDERFFNLSETFKDAERLKDKNDEISECYTALRYIIDATHAYLQNKKTKLTPLQSKALSVILELRKGCSICGILDGAHTQQCAHLTVTNPK